MALEFLFEMIVCSLLTEMFYIFIAEKPKLYTAPSRFEMLSQLLVMSIVTGWASPIFLLITSGHFHVYPEPKPLKLRYAE